MHLPLSWKCGGVFDSEWLLVYFSKSGLSTVKMQETAQTYFLWIHQVNESGFETVVMITFCAWLATGALLSDSIILYP